MAIVQQRYKLKTPAEMEAIREKDAILKAEQLKSFVPEKTKADHYASFVVERYVTGPVRGLFSVYQVISEDQDGKPLKKPAYKTLIEGTDMFNCANEMRRALEVRLSRRPKADK